VLYLEGLIAGALTQTNNIGIVSAFPNIQVIRRTAGFYLGVQDAAKLLNKEVNVYVKYVGDWYLPTEERDIASTLVDQYKCDVITQQTDSGSHWMSPQKRHLVRGQGHGYRRRIWLVEHRYSRGIFRYSLGSAL